MFEFLPPDKADELYTVMAELSEWCRGEFRVDGDFQSLCIGGGYVVSAYDGRDHISRVRNQRIEKLCVVVRRPRRIAIYADAATWRDEFIERLDARINAGKFLQMSEGVDELRALSAEQREMAADIIRDSPGLTHYRTAVELMLALRNPDGWC